MYKTNNWTSIEYDLHLRTMDKTVIKRRHKTTLWIASILYRLSAEPVTPISLKCANLDAGQP